MIINIFFIQDYSRLFKDYSKILFKQKGDTNNNITSITFINLICFI